MVNHVSEFLATGGTVTIKLYDVLTSNPIGTDDDSCDEVGNTGEYKWDKANITTVPTPYKEYAYVMTDGSESRSGMARYKDFLIQYIIHENMGI